VNAAADHDNAPRIRRRLDAPIPQFPELDHCVGRVIEITVLGDGAAVESTDAGGAVAPFCQSTISEGAEELLPPDAGVSAPRVAIGSADDSTQPSHLEVAPADAADAVPPAPVANAEEPFEHPIEEFLTDWQRARRRGGQ
jgi:hypothetical protein